nr:MAG TPA: hypothetical protein [Caudoviricetes sp.]
MTTQEKQKKSRKNTTDLKVGLIIRKATGSKLKKDFMKLFTIIHQMKNLINF